MTPHRSDGLLLTSHTGVFNEISFISVNNYRTDIISFNLGVKYKIMDEINSFAVIISD